jgi:hypothetical protein
MGTIFFGSPILVKDFPEAKCVATSSVVDCVKGALSGENLCLWKGMFPNGQIPNEQTVPKPLPTNSEFSIDDHSLFRIDVVLLDTQCSSFLHLPNLKLVVSGDIVYGECSQHFGEANTTEKRKHWLDALDQIAALEPSIVVLGHKRESQADGPYLIDLTKEYILGFEKN